MDRYIKIGWPLFTVLIYFFVIVSCNQEEKEKNIFIEDEILASINNQKITLTEFEKNLQSFLQQSTLLQKQYKHNKQKINKLILDKIIIEEIILQEANRKNIIIDNQEISQQSSNIIFDGVNENITRYLNDGNTTFDQWLDEFKNSLIIRRIIEEEVISKIRITKQEVADYFKANKKKYTVGKQHQVLHILVKTKETADNIIKLLKNNADFEDLVSIYSIAADKRTSGNLGFIEKNELPVELDKAIFQLKKEGELSEIIESSFGYHIFKLKNIKARETKKLSQVREQIVRQLREEKSEKAVTDWLRKLRDSATIVIREKVLDNYINL